ncbi:hypothetical protein [Streptosporangium sp. 'caverna']|uniref:hypothetical protein n=1 Tax=Streptosporangium sp. 'caverna' TaxID=2202249 RepID=UPI0013A7009E|nr:hypothetical protein [Streptosporangium sp. 'caverna']
MADSHHDADGLGRDRQSPGIHDVVAVEILVIRKWWEPHVSWQRSWVLSICVSVHADPQMHLPPLHSQPAPFPSSGFVVVQLLEDSPVVPVVALLIGYFLPGRKDVLGITVFIQVACHAAQLTAAASIDRAFAASAGNHSPNEMENIT